MQLWIDDTQLDTIDSLELAFELARKHTEQTHRLIIDIQADGHPIDEHLLDEPPSSCAGITELRLITTDHDSFLTETIHTAKEALVLTRVDQQRAANEIRSGEMSDAMESLNAVLEGWHAVKEVVEQAAALAEIDIEALSFGETTGARCIENLSKALAEVRASLEKQDLSSLGDAIEYDLDEQSVAWETLLIAMIGAIGSGSGAHE